MRPTLSRLAAYAALLVLLLACAVGGRPAAAAALQPDKIGIVLMHGKLGAPFGSGAGGNSTRSGGGGLGEAPGGKIVAALRRAGYLVETPEMCWSRYRGFDLPYTDCFHDIDAAVAKLKSRGADAIVVGGLSLGGNAALGYGATHPGLLGVIGFNPADDPVAKARRPEGAETIAHAEALIAQGKGDEETRFSDMNTGPQSSYATSLETTARIYMSFYGPNSQSGLAANAAKLTAPLLWVKGTRDPTQRNEPDYAYDKAAKNALNRFVTVPGNHISTPDEAIDEVLAWLKEIAAGK